MPKLSDTQLVILASAAQRDDRAVLPLPSSIKLNRGAVTTVLTAMLKRGLVEKRSCACKIACNTGPLGGDFRVQS